MAGPHLGYIGRSTHRCSFNKLFATEGLRRYFQIWDCSHVAGFFALCYLVSDWRFEYIRLPLGERCFYHDIQRNWRTSCMELALVVFTGFSLTGFDASGHIAEETKNASVVAGRGIITGVVATGLLGFNTVILFLFCTPDLDLAFSLDAPQPFVQIYSLALGRGGSIVMTIIAVINLIMNSTVAIVAASRLVFAVARDGVLPLSGWIGRVTSDGQPKNAVTVIYVFAATILCTILPSQVAFTSLVSASAVPTVAAYGLIPLLRLTMTPNHFQSSHFRLGKFAKPFYVCAVLFNGLIVAAMISPFLFPVDANNFNFACVIFGAATIFGIVSWYLTPEEKCLSKKQVANMARG